MTRSMHVASLMVAMLLIAGCGGGGSGAGTTPPPAGSSGTTPPAAGSSGTPPPPAGSSGNNPTPVTTDSQLRALIQSQGLTGDPMAGRALPSIDDPLPQLGKLLFFTKALSGNLDTACASCHHPALGGADGLSLSVGPGAVDPGLLGAGRRLAAGLQTMGRNAPTFFNTGLYDSGLFHDSRVESLNKTARSNGVGGAIRTPDVPFNTQDTKAGASLPAAQARFPVVQANEMRGNLEPAMTGAEIRDHLAARLGNYGSGTGLLASSQWLERFRTAFRSSGTAQELITFDNIALALAEYERSATFTDTPWNRYVRGDAAAISAPAKEGALMFFRTTAEGGAACAQCHSGDTFTDERHHALGFPQIGPGKGDGTSSRDDFGRGRESGVESDRYRFRTPSLLNVELTAPYGHAGAYIDLETVFGHYVVPDNIVGDYLGGAAWCRLPQFQGVSDCATMFPAAADLTRAALAKMNADRSTQPADSMPVVDPDRVPQTAIEPMVQFLQTLTDPCLKNRACFGRWIPGAAEAPDAHQLNAVDAAGRQL